MELLSTLAIVALAGIIHASFQLSLSMLTLISGHTIGRRSSHRRVIRRAGSFIFGVVLMTLLLFTFAIYALEVSFMERIPPLAWSVGCGLLMGLGIAVWAFYYRKAPGTTLWLPRSLASFLADRTKATKSSSEAFSLGMASVVAEILFIVAPLVVAAMTLAHINPLWQIVGILLYVTLASLPLLLVGMMIGGGHKLSHIQKWREHNKRFLQFTAGSALIILGFYIYVERALYITVTSLGGV